MDQAQPVGRIDVISDVICPWCYVGKRQLEHALDLLEKQHLRFTVAWHPFQLNPDMPCEGVDRAQYRIAKFGSLERSRQLDERITGGWKAFDATLTANHVPHEGHVYKGANHGFHNDTTPRYDEAAAKLAWQRTLDWFNKYLRTSA